jgi:hypothetical protein
MKNVHLIPTDKPSRLGRFVDTGNLFLRTPNDLPRGENVNVYITYDSKIREGYYLDLTHNIVMKSVFYPSSDKNCKKIILTTDPILIQSGVQEIDEDFLEWLVQNPSCDSVKIDLVPVNEFGSEITVGGYGFDKFKYKIIPKEEPKQETLEEAAKNYLKTLHGVNYKSLYHFSQQQTSAFINGAKSEAARNYWFEEFQNKLI